MLLDSHLSTHIISNSRYIFLLFLQQGKLKSLTNVGNKDGVTPIYAAAIQGQHEAVKVLLKNEAFVDKVNELCLADWLPLINFEVEFDCELFYIYNSYSLASDRWNNSLNGSGLSNSTTLVSSYVGQNSCKRWQSGR